MKLLVDENLAPSLASHIADLFSGSVHVSSVGLSQAPDDVIWDYAGANGFIFVTKDKDFANLSIAFGAPPKVILMQTGNCSTAEIERIIRRNAVALGEFENDTRRGLMLLR